LYTRSTIENNSILHATSLFLELYYFHVFETAPRPSNPGYEQTFTEPHSFYPGRSFSESPCNSRPKHSFSTGQNLVHPLPIRPADSLNSFASHLDRHADVSCNSSYTAVSLDSDVYRFPAFPAQHFGLPMPEPHMNAFAVQNPLIPSFNALYSPTSSQMAMPFHGDMPLHNALHQSYPSMSAAQDDVNTSYTPLDSAFDFSSASGAHFASPDEFQQSNFAQRYPAFVSPVQSSAFPILHSPLIPTTHQPQKTRQPSPAISSKRLQAPLPASPLPKEPPRAISPVGPPYNMNSHVLLNKDGVISPFDLAQLDKNPQYIIDLLRSTTSEKGTWMIVCAHYRRMKNYKAAVAVALAMLQCKFIRLL
jgi:hypothetical protein